MIKQLTLSLLLILVFALTACADDGGDDATSGAVQAIEDYLQARVDSDEAALQQLVCAEREGEVEQMAMSFAAVENLRLEDMACTLDSSTDDSATVSCDGQMIGDYGTGDETAFDLETYRVVQEDGVWRWCGETAASS